MAMLSAKVVTLFATIVSCHGHIIHKRSGDITPDIGGPLPGIWIGTAPFCKSSPSDCDVFDFDYVTTHNAGDGNSCWTGSKVLCEIKKPKKVGPPTPVNTIQIVSYNVFERPFYLAHDGQKERTCRIPYKLFDTFPDVDVFIFQESFMGGCFKDDAMSMREIFQLHGIQYSTKTTGTKFIQVLNGGIFILSRWPIVAEEHHIYTEYHSWEADQFSKKGVAYAKIMKTVSGESKAYHIFGTHLQAQTGSDRDEVREKQAVELSTFVEKQGIPSSEPVFIGGDFNADKIYQPQHATRVISFMKSILPPTVGDNIHTTNTLDDSFGTPKWLDYVVYRTDHEAPVTGTLETHHIKHERPFDVCFDATLQPAYIWPNTWSCFKTIQIDDLSDHYPVLAKFTF